ncbi:c-type cytochrome [Sporosarcina sp. Marseille-Q4063]|uniref:c-type cytochrome n=1 Tax=Sporosarcina sp. Marseille-Q4063 TaxID=2810514 RepID=UPI001BAF67DF|nr:c-type cytochrome [Sporosarcina sp. Marseille-Q4063]QUW20779.1 c-type cytochrome [Sporosarcina sp. Marseille-Q4063]
MNRRSLLIFIGFLLIVPLVIIVITQGGFIPKVGNATHDPPSINDIPEGQLGEAILRGRDLLHDTSNILRSEAASIEDGEKRVNELTCTSCHAGNGIDENVSSLVGVSGVYPIYRDRSDNIVTLEDRINGCMVRSMNGQPFPEGDEDVKAMIAYITYISKGVPIGSEPEWLGKNDMENVPTPDVAEGEEMFQQTCITCHASDGAGTGPNTGPALWGEGSFNDGAGMARLSKFAGFIKNNMPQDDPGSLSKQEAANIAAYVLSQDRPEWQGHDDDWPNGGGPTDIMTKELREQVKNDTIDWDKVLGERK